MWGRGGLVERDWDGVRMMRKKKSLRLKMELSGGGAQE